MVSEEQLLEWDQQIDDHTLCWSWAEKAQLIAELRRYHLLQKQFDEYQKSFANTVQILVETRAECNNLKESLKREVEHLTISINERVKLEKEADWLADHLENTTEFCIKTQSDSEHCDKWLLDGACARCWREAARKACREQA